MRWSSCRSMQVSPCPAHCPTHAPWPRPHPLYLMLCPGSQCLGVGVVRAMNNGQWESGSLLANLIPPLPMQTWSPPLGCPSPLARRGWRCGTARTCALVSPAHVLTGERFHHWSEPAAVPCLGENCAGRSNVGAGCLYVPVPKPSHLCWLQARRCWCWGRPAAWAWRQCRCTRLPTVAKRLHGSLKSAWEVKVPTFQACQAVEKPTESSSFLLPSCHVLKSSPCCSGCSWAR